MIGEGAAFHRSSPDGVAVRRPISTRLHNPRDSHRAHRAPRKVDHNRESRNTLRAFCMISSIRSNSSRDADVRVVRHRQQTGPVHRGTLSLRIEAQSLGSIRCAIPGVVTTRVLSRSDQL
jgi:hypothetical protein